MARARATKDWLLRMLDDGDDQAPLQRDGDAEIDVLVVVDGAAFKRGVDDGELLQRVRRRRRR